MLTSVIAKACHVSYIMIGPPMNEGQLTVHTNGWQLGLQTNVGQLGVPADKSDLSFLHARGHPQRAVHL